MKRRQGLTDQRLAYRAPALEKGLDVLELLAHERQPMSLREIGLRLGRSKGELFRMLVVLQSRGYLQRDEAGDAFFLTPRLFELGMRTPFVRDLLDAALPEMQKLAQATQQSAHLVVPSRGETVVVGVVSGGQDMSFSLKLGYRRPLVHATSGRIILSFQPRATAERWIEESRGLPGGEVDQGELDRALRQIRRRGFEIHPSRDVVGITDIGCPVLDGQGDAVAALIVPFVNRVAQRTDQEALLQAVLAAARAIAQAYSGGVPRGL